MKIINEILAKNKITILTKHKLPGKCIAVFVNLLEKRKLLTEKKNITRNTKIFPKKKKKQGERGAGSERKSQPLQY